MRVTSLRLFLIGAIIAISPIYWLPGVDAELINYAKLIAFAALVATSLGSTFYVSRYAFLILTAMSLIIIATFLAGLAHSEVAEAASAVRSVALSLTWTLLLLAFPVQHVGKLINAILAGTLVFLVVALYPLMAGIGLAPDIHVPGEMILRYGDNFDYLIGSLTVSGAGFNTGATGWGPPVAMYALLAASAIRSLRYGRSYTLQIAWVILAFAMIATIVSGARGATSALTVGIGLYFIKRSWLPALAAGLGLALLVYLAAGSDVGSSITIASSPWEKLDDLMTGRLTTYVHAVNTFISSPLLGSGVHSAKVDFVGGHSIAIHNIWLRAAAEGGLLLLLPTILLAILCVILLIQVERGSPASRHIALYGGHAGLGSVVLFGLIVALVEPGVIVGSFNNNAIFWAAVALSLRFESQGRRAGGGAHYGRGA